MSLYEAQEFNVQEDDSSDLLEPSDMMGPDSIVNQSNQGGMKTGSPTRALVLLWFAALGMKWLLALLFRGNIRG